MKKHIISAGLITTIIFLSVLFLGSCSKNSVNPSYEKNIPGTWYFHKVKLARSFSLGNKDITDQYAGIKITFNTNHTVQWTDAAGQSFSGSWVLERDYHCADENSNAYFILDVNINNQPDKSFTGTSLYVSKNRIGFSQGKSEGTYTVTLKRD